MLCNFGDEKDGKVKKIKIDKIPSPIYFINKKM